jgi:hypothetical protein
MTESGANEKAGDVTSAIDADVELQAMRAVLGALVPLNREGRARVLDYVLNRLGMAGEVATAVPGGSSYQSIGAEKPTQVSGPAITDIRSLKEAKSPRSGNEMAAIVAYYLAELAPARRLTINAEDIKKYFLEARYELPTNTRQLLVNAKNAGYLESAGSGQYRLNSVGYNLVMHKLPSPSAKSPTSKKPGQRKLGGKAKPTKKISRG